jgi:NAD(P)-dependent dehydrogenase (short-subunit alcohol dehydrogenase family)
MLSKHKDKIAIVTGGTGVLGSVIVNVFAAEGMKVYVPVRDIEKFKMVFDESSVKEFRLKKVYALPCYPTDELLVTEFIESIIKLDNKIDYLINTIGGYHTKKYISEMDSELIDKMWELNFKSTFYFTKNVLPVMIKNKFGRIISVSAKPAVEPTPGKFAYSVSKQAVLNLMQTVTEENKKYNITAHTIIPLIIDTPANRASMPGSDYNKWEKPENIAKAILSLLTSSDGNSKILKMFGEV